MDSQSSLSKAKTFLYVISFSFLELCFLFSLLRRNHGLMPERKGKKIKHFFVGLYKKFISFDGLFRRQHPCWSTLKIFKICLSLVSLSIFTQTNTAQQPLFSAFDSESLFSLVCGVALCRESSKMEQTLNFQVPAEGLELVILLHTQY